MAKWGAATTCQECAEMAACNAIVTTDRAAGLVAAAGLAKAITSILARANERADMARISAGEGSAAVSYVLRQVRHNPQRINTEAAEAAVRAAARVLAED